MTYELPILNYCPLCYFNTTILLINQIISTFLDHIITNSCGKVSQKGVIDVGISDHQWIYCTRKIKRIKHNMHKQIQVRSLKKYSAEVFTNALKTVQFPNYNTFSNVNVAYSDHLNKIPDTIDSVAPIRERIYKFWWQKNANIFKIFVCTLANNLLANLPPPTWIFGLHSVRQYYEKILKYSNSKFKFNFVSGETVLKLLQDLCESFG